MTFLQPTFLWGLMAIAVPILIHLWHQKRGQPLPWAAMQWLQEVSEQQKRGLQFDDWLLLALRCLAITLLSVLLAQPVRNNPNEPNAVQRVHLVVADSLVTRSFRFELEQATKRGEMVVRVPGAKPINPLRLQATIDSLRGPDRLLHLYLPVDVSLADVPQITVPERFSLHAAVSPAAKTIPTVQPLASRLARVKRPIYVRLDYRKASEQRTVQAALRALATVHNLRFAYIGPENATPQPDWVLTDNIPSPPNPRPSTLYVISGAGQPPQILPNVVFTADTLTPHTSERVANGQLPEWLGEQILRFYKLNTPPPALTEQELTHIFVQTKETKSSPTRSQRTNEQNWLLLALLLVIGAERWLALRK